jgi:hypothetical protein
VAKKPDELVEQSARFGPPESQPGMSNAAPSRRSIMRNVLFVLLLLVVAVVALAYYRGWLIFEKTSDPETGRQGVKVEVDRNKITPDIDKAKQSLGGGGTPAKEKQEGQQP